MITTRSPRSRVIPRLRAGSPGSGSSFPGILIAATVVAVALVGVLAAGTAQAQTATVMLPPQADTFLAEFNPNANYGSRWWIFHSGDRNFTARALLRFDLSSLPPGTTITGARLELYKWGGDSRGDRVAVHAVTTPWVERGPGGTTWLSSGGAPWANPGGDYVSSPVTTVRLSNGAGWKSWDVTPLVQQWVSGARPNHGFLLKHPTENGNRPWSLFASRESFVRPRLIITYTAPAGRPDIVIVKAAQTDSDPVNGTTNPKAIPGANVLYTLRTLNVGTGPADTNSVVLTDPLPVHADLVVTDLAGAGSGPVLFRDGPTPSGVAYTFAGLGSGADDLDFSRDGGASWNYAPVPDANGVDPAVTHLRVRPRGALAASAGSPSPGFELRFKVRVR